jgi:lipopolysaccharide export system permease protein
MPGLILNRLIFRELLKVFVLSLATVTGLLVIVPVYQEASRLGLSLNQVLEAIPLTIPNMLPYTIPATTLFAACVVYGRLAHDNEVVAIKAAGVHLFVILRPALLLGVITTGITAALYHTIIPRSQKLLYERLLDDPEELLYNLLRRDRCLRHPQMPYVIYVRDIQGRRLIDVVVKRRNRVVDPQTRQEFYFGYDVVARAREGRLRVDPTEGKLYLDPDRFVIYDRNTIGATAPTGPFQMDLPEGWNGRDRVRTSALTWDELPQRVAQLQEQMAAKQRQRQEVWEQIERIPDPVQREALRLRAREEERHYDYQLQFLQRQLRNTLVEWYQRPALAFGCLIFALLGCPVGIWANRADYLSIFVMCFLPALLVYYPLQLAGAGLGRDGKLPLSLACWLANIVVGLGALVLNWRLLRR